MKTTCFYFDKKYKCVSFIVHCIGLSQITKKCVYCAKYQVMYGKRERFL